MEIEIAVIANVDDVIRKKYDEIKGHGKILEGIDVLNRQIRFKYPKLAEHVKKRMLEIAKEKGDLP